MKKLSLFFLSLISCICAFANSPVDVETDSISNDELQEFYSFKQRRTLRGLKVFVDTGFLWSIDNNDGYDDPDEYFLPNLFPVTASVGYQFNNYIFVGGGTGMHLYATSRKSYLTVPLFWNVRINFRNGKVSPFLDFRNGVTLGSCCGYLGDIGLGVRVAMKDRHALFMTLQYDGLLNFYGPLGDGWYGMVLGLKAGYEF